MTGLESSIQTPHENFFGIKREASLQRSPLDLELLVTTHLTPERLPGQPRRQLAIAASNLQIILSNARLEIISRFVNLLSESDLTCLASNRGVVKNTSQEPPRLADLAHQVEYSLALSTTGLEVAVISDSQNGPRTPTYAEREIIVEECISDFLSFLACFDINFPVKDALIAAERICLDRLIALGMTEAQAIDCAETARFNFLGDIQLMKKTQTHILRELSESAVFTAADLPRTSGHGLVDIPEEMLNSDSSSDVDMGEEGSEESAELVETAIRNAVEKTLLSFLQILEHNYNEMDDNRDIMVLDVQHGLVMTLTKTFYDSHVDLQVPSAALRNSAGVHLIRIGKPVPRDPEHLMEENNHCIVSDSRTRRGMQLSFFEVDQGHPFAEGGLPLSILGTDDPTQRPTREKLINVVVSDINIFFAHKVVSDIIDTAAELVSSLKRHLLIHHTPLQLDDPKAKTASETVASFMVANLSLMLASDELQPFCGLMVNDITGKRGLSGKSGDSDRLQRLALESPMVELLNFGPECQYFPEVISPCLPAGLHTPASQKMIFRLIFLPSSNPWIQGAALHVYVENARVTVLRQFINEVIQFTSSESYGLGKLLNKYACEGNLDRDGNPPQPLRYEIEVKNGSVLVPRSSGSLDMVAIEAGNIFIANSYHSESFEMPSATSALKKNPSTTVGKPMCEQSLSDQTTGSVDSDFFDCVDAQDEIQKEDNPQSTFDRASFRRIVFKIEQARLFTSLSERKFEKSTSNGTLLRHFFRVNGRASNHKRIYWRRPTATDANSSRLDDIVNRYWEEISVAPLDLEILVDYAPHLRVLISDRLDDSCMGSAINLDVRMSQFYLLLSIWYANMQELPIMFPYSPSEIKSSAKLETPPASFPEFGSIDFVDWLKDLTAIRSEIACSFEKILLICSFDKSGYFDSDPACLKSLSRVFENGSLTGKNKIFSVQLDCPTLHVTGDSNGILRIGVGATGLKLLDERRQGDFKTVFDVGSTVFWDEEEFLDHDVDFPMKAGSWANLTWGLDCNGNTLDSALPLPVQASVYMTPGWVLTNIGIESANAIMFDLTPIWIILDFFSLYFSKDSYGNPTFEAETRKEKLKMKLETNESSFINSCVPGGLNIDFRLWLTRPHICIPSTTLNRNAPSLRLDCESGFWYRYKALDYFTSQEMCSTNLGLSFAKGFEIPRKCRVDYTASTDSSMRVGTKTLIDSLSFGLRIDANSVTEHTDYTVRIPFLGRNAYMATSVCSIVSNEIVTDTVELLPPSVCSPALQHGRNLGVSICELTLIIDVLPFASDLLLTFVTGSIDAKETTFINVSYDDTAESASVTQTGVSFSANASISGMRLFAIDPVLGMHLPIAVCSLSSVKVSASQLLGDASGRPALRGESPPGDFQLAIDSSLWADYFKLGTTRSWEPFLEPFSCLFLFEKSSRRGQGMSLHSECPFHFNVTGSLLLIADEAITSFSRAFKESFASKKPRCSESEATSHNNCESSRAQYAGTYVDQEVDSSLGSNTIRHHIPMPLHSDDRVAFSILNLTGQRIRIHQQSGETEVFPHEKTAVVTYLGHLESTKLEFEATVSVIRNLQVVDVPFPGLPHSQRDRERQGTMDPAIDVQLPGFRWIQGMSVDTSGRKFNELVPRSPAILAKTQKDWRLMNCTMLLTEVGIENGGRLITLRSLFEIHNHTSHSICLALHPDPTHCPIFHESNTTPISVASAEPSNKEADFFETIGPGAAYQVPFLLLESALRLKGSHLGSFWIRPDSKNQNAGLFELLATGGEPSMVDTAIGYCSRPVQLAKVVHESSQIFAAANGDDVAFDGSKSGIQVSCPISDGNDGVPLAPFCYALEIRRSPIVKTFEEETDVLERPRVNFALHKKQATLGENNSANSAKKARRHDFHSSYRYKHGPVAYSLAIHPPLVIENLLPTRGRFELMHATRKTVLWFRDLKPGERIPVHTVGLDAPLLLLVNLGFCRTPVGEGALIHHGTEIRGMFA